MVELAGSEVLTLELAEALARRGFEVTVYAHVVGDPIAQIARDRGISLTTSEAALADPGVGLVWIHHQAIPASLASTDAASRATVVFGHMSPFEPLELPLLTDIEARLADVIVANSDETADALRGFGLGDVRMVVLGNPAPDSFWESPGCRVKALRTLLVVSHHPPRELRDAMERLRAEGVTVEHIGGRGQSAVVTPETVAAADAVLTIGKTVQYALAVGRAVFCYDVHGGPGWLSAKDLSLARRHNFSGRPFGRMSAEAIVQAVIGGFDGANAEVDSLRDAVSDLTWGRGLDAVFAATPSSRGVGPRLTEADRSRVEATNTLFRRLAREHQDLAVSVAAERTLSRDLAARDRHVARQQTELDMLVRSSSWRLTEPLRRLAGRLRLCGQSVRSSARVRQPGHAAPEVVRVESLPALAWLCRLSGRSSRVFVGPEVDVSSNGISEGGWVGPFRHSSLGESHLVFGSGVVFAGDGPLFVPPSHPREALYVLQNRRSDVCCVSNSMTFALAQLPPEVHRRFCVSLSKSLRATVDRATALGVDGGATELHVEAGYRLSRIAFFRFRTAGARPPVLLPDSPTEPFEDYRAYRDHVSRSLADLFANAAHVGRSRSLRPLVALSRGYDSTAVAVLAAENGCRTAVTLDVAVYGKHDSGQEIARKLGLDVIVRSHVMGSQISQLTHAFDRELSTKATEFLATDGVGDDVVYLPFEPDLRQGMLLTGVWGDTVWPRDADVGVGLPLRTPYNRSLTEFRLRVGFAHVPVPYIGGRAGDSIGRISRSGEMAGFSVGGDYDRPIPRRIGEEAGLDRSDFGTEKVATAPLATNGQEHFVDALDVVGRRYVSVGC